MHTQRARICFLSTILGAESRSKTRVNTISVHARQPQLFLINHPASACLPGGRGGGFTPTRETGSQSTRTGTSPLMLGRSAAGCRRLRPAVPEWFAVSRIRPCRSSPGSYVHGDGRRTRLTECARGWRCGSVAARTDRAGTHLDRGSSGWMWPLPSAPSTAAPLRSAPPTV